MSRPPFWENPSPLARPPSSDGTIEGSPLHAAIRAVFPLFDDIELYVEDMVGTAQPATIRAYSPALGFIGDLGPAERLLRDARLDLPDPGDPLFDLDQGYDIYACADETHAYYVAGAWDAESTDFTTYWRTPLATLARAWTLERERCLVAYADGDPALNYPTLRWFFGTGGARGRAGLLAHTAWALDHELAKLTCLPASDALEGLRAIGYDAESGSNDAIDPVGRLRRAVENRKRAG